MKIALTATLNTVGLLFVELSMRQMWAARRFGQLQRVMQTILSA